MAPRISTFLVFFFSLSSWAAVPAKLELNRAESEVRFTAMGRPSLLRIKGEGAHATGALEETGGRYIGTISVSLDEFQTGIALRDKHMKEKYLELGKPENTRAELRVAALDAACVSEAAGAEKTCPFAGTLTLHGKTQPVSGTVAVKGSAGAKRITAEWTLKLSDYGIAVPQFAGITVADEVRVSAEAKAEEKAR